MKNKLKVSILVGTRPGIVKMSPLYHAAIQRGHEACLVHSGQHYSKSMDEDIYSQVGLPPPAYRYFRPESAVTHGALTAYMLVSIEEALISNRPDFFFVCGDADTNLAGALAARKLHIPIGHVESGLRSGDMRMPEEANRRMIDHISDLLFAPTQEAANNLLVENVWGNIHVVGNTIVDSVLKFRGENHTKQNFAVLTLHREENVDDPSCLYKILVAVQDILKLKNMVARFYVHPRTQSRLQNIPRIDRFDRISFCKPIGYTDMLKIIASSRFVMTDSGGLQEEACILGTPCYTLRSTTERPESVAVGANVLLGVDRAYERFIELEIPEDRQWVSPYGDGKASERIYDVTEKHLFG
jgi:UDP-N-acetylglucosamine 2-epimerase (non-hydrolysing)